MSSLLTVTAQQLLGNSDSMKALSERLAAHINSSLIPVERYRSVIHFASV